MPCAPASTSPNVSLLNLGAKFPVPEHAWLALLTLVEDLHAYSDDREQSERSDASAFRMPLR